MKKNIINLKGAHKLAIGEYDDDLYLNEVTHVFVRPKTASNKRVYIEALKALLTDALYWMHEEDEEVQSIYLDDEWIGEVVYALDFNMLDEANGVPTYNPNIPTLVVDRAVSKVSSFQHAGTKRSIWNLHETGRYLPAGG